MNPSNSTRWNPVSDCLTVLLKLFAALFFAVPTAFAQSNKCESSLDIQADSYLLISMAQAAGHGDAMGLQMLEKTRAKIDSAVAKLAEQNSASSEAKGVQKAWLELRKPIATLLLDGPAVVKAATAQQNVLEIWQAIATLADDAGQKILTKSNDANAANQIFALGRLTFIAMRIAKKSTDMIQLADYTVISVAADSMSRDQDYLAAQLDGLIDGNKALDIQKVTGSAASSLKKAQTMFLAIKPSMKLLVDSANKLESYGDALHVLTDMPSTLNIYLRGTAHD
jgi:hypothetical protein